MTRLVEICRFPLADLQAAPSVFELIRNQIAVGRTVGMICDGDRLCVQDNVEDGVMLFREIDE